MFAVIMVCRKRYDFSIAKCVILTAFICIIGFLCTKLFFFIENGRFDGMSFFGAVFFLPVLLYPVARIMKAKYLELMDITAVAGVAMLSIMKIHCMVAKCCGGRIIGYTEIGEAIRFPSRICELMVALIDLAILLWFVKKDILRAKKYPCLMIVYGVERFILNLFRETEPFIFGMGIGNLWAFDCFIIGIVWILVIKVIETKKSKVGI